MKKIITLFFCLALMSNIKLAAQELKQEAELVKSIVGKVKKDFVSQNLSVPVERSAEFWDLYNTYDAKRTDLAQQRTALVAAYLLYFNADDKKIDYSIIKNAFKLQKLESKNLEKFYKKIEKKVDPKTAMQFYQVEQFIRTSVDNYLFKNLPLK